MAITEAQVWWARSGLAEAAAIEVALFMVFCVVLMIYLGWRDK